MSIETALQGLRDRIAQSTYQGDFLLSINEISHVWIFLNDLWKGDTARYIEDILKVVFRNLLAEHESFSLFSADILDQIATIETSDTGTTEEELPVDKIANTVVKDLQVDTIRRLKFSDLDLIKQTGENRLPRKCVGVYALSIHIDLIKEAIEALRRYQFDVVAIVAVAEREQVSRPELTALGATLIPLVVLDEDHDTTEHILQMSKEPYKSLHRYFA